MNPIFLGDLKRFTKCIYISFYKGNAVIKPGMPLEAKTIMDQCVKLLTHLSEAIKQGDVTTRELALLAHRRLQWKSLYCQLPNLRESDKQLSLERATDQRLQELNHFNMSRENLNVLCRHIYHKEHISGECIEKIIVLQAP